ncbi:hypothetical protein GQ600_22158 [Phytophthora cactorum]|nr:hypothetical protein GQ600_22158 [Phytophthora cactorum]
MQLSGPRRRDSDGFRDIECRSRADSRVLLRRGRGGETRGLLNKLRGSTVSAVCSAYYALTDTEFCSEMIRLHQLGRSFKLSSTRSGKELQSRPRMRDGADGYRNPCIPQQKYDAL